MMVVGMLAFAIDGRGFWTLPKSIALGLHDGATSSRTEFALAIASGLAVHAMVALALGFIFAFVVNAFTHEFVWTGILFGVGLWALDATLVSALVPSMRVAMDAAPASGALFAHATFGCVLALLARRNVVITHGVPHFP